MACVDDGSVILKSDQQGEENSETTTELSKIVEFMTKRNL